MRCLAKCSQFRFVPSAADSVQEAVARPALAAITIRAHHNIVAGKRMPSRAIRSLGAPDILLCRHRLQVIRVDASRRFAEMVELQPFGYRPNQIHINNSVREHRSFLSVDSAPADPRIAHVVHTSRPNPAAIGIPGVFCKKTLQNRRLFHASNLTHSGVNHGAN